MTNDFRMSYFMPPIAPIKNEQGRISYSSNTGSLLRSLRRTSFSNDNLQRESQNSDRASTQFRRYTDSKSITIAIRDSLWYVLASKQQMFRSFFTSWWW